MAGNTVTSTGDPASRPRTVETAPSRLAHDRMTSTRLLGFMGAILAVCGGTVIVTTAVYGPRWIPGPAGTLLFLLGLLGLLNHALRDGDSQVRRMYISIGLAWLFAALLATVIPGGKGETTMAGYYFLSWGVPFLVLSLLFLAAPARHEPEGIWYHLSHTSVLAVGVILGLVGLGFGILRHQDFLLQYGLVLTALSLIYLTTFIGMTDANEGPGYGTALGLGIVGFLVGLYGLLRGAGPWLLYQFGATTVRPDSYLVPFGVVLIGVGLLFLLVALGVLSDLSVVVIARRELSTFFYSPIAYLVLFAVTMVAVVQFGQFMSSFNMRGDVGFMVEPIVASYLIHWIPVVTILVIVPALTMRLFSEERRTGTLEMLLTAPIGEWSIVLGKFFAALIMFLVVCLPWVLFLLAFRVETGKEFDYRPLMAFGIAVMVTGAGFVSMGMFFSAVTRNQIIAAVLTFGGMSLLLMAYLFARSVGNPDLQAVLDHLSFVSLWIESVSGRLYLRDVLLHLSMTAFWLYLTVQVLEARKWA
jgi:ABC-type transport system involved in multi-copper enzyme maturation permease subunit